MSGNMSMSSTSAKTQNVETDFLNQFDFTSIEQADPSIADGHQVVYDRDVPIELRLQDAQGAPQEIGSVEAIRVKILTVGPEDSPENVKVELTSETDVFFHYIHSVHPNIFKEMQEKQKLVIEYNDYLTVLIKMCNSCIKEPNSFLGVFVMQLDGLARLDFIQNMEYKFLELLSCDFVQSTETATRENIQFRYNAAKSKIALMQARLQDVSALIRLKNPSLLLQLRRHNQTGAGRTDGTRSVYRI